MSTITQQEIASIDECDSTNPKQQNAIFLHVAMLACIIVFVIGLSIYISTINKTAAFCLLPLLLFCAYPIYRLLKAGTAYMPFALIFALTFLSCLAIMLIYIPNDAFGKLPLFMVCFLLLVVFTALILLTISIKKILTKELCAFTAIMFFSTLSVLLLIYFKDSTSQGFGFSLWQGVVLKISLKSMALTYAGLTFFSITIIALLAYIFAEKTLRITSRYITYVATFAALSVVFKIMGNAVSNTFGVFSTQIRFTLVYIPWIAAGIVIGLDGALIATAIGDFLGQILLPSGGTWFWLTWLSNLLFPLFPIMMYRFIRLRGNYDWLKILIGMIISSAVCTLGLGTLAISILYETSYLATLATRPVQLIVIAINYLLILMLLPVLNRAKLPKSSLRSIQT